jgi:hypothetical protein
MATSMAMLEFVYCNGRFGRSTLIEVHGYYLFASLRWPTAEEIRTIDRRTPHHE